MFLLSTHLSFFIFVSSFFYLTSSFPASFLSLRCFWIGHDTCHGSFNWVILQPQNTSLVLISLDWFWIFNYTLFSSDCFTMKPRLNHHETMMTYAEDITHVMTPWLDRFCIFNAHTFAAITFLTNTTFLICFLFSLTVSTIPFLMSVTFFSSYSF